MLVNSVSYVGKNLYTTLFLLNGDDELIIYIVKSIANPIMYLE